MLKPLDISKFVPKDLTKVQTPDNLIASMVFTAGSTGLPKAALITHSMFVNQINALTDIEELRTDNIMSTSAIRWISQLYIMFLPFVLGTTKTFSGKKSDPANICDAIQKWKVSAILSFGSNLMSIMKYYEECGSYDFSSMRYLISGGEAPCASMNKRFKEIMPSIKILQGYGITECGGGIAAQSNLSSVNGGPLCKGFSCKIVDENGNNVDHNVPGTVYI